MLIDCHVHAGELGKHYPSWWMAELYRARARGADTSEAVNTASRRIVEARRKAGVTVHPFFWGAFVAAGKRDRRTDGGVQRQAPPTPAGSEPDGEAWVDRRRRHVDARRRTRARVQRQRAPRQPIVVPDAHRPHRIDPVRDDAVALLRPRVRDAARHAQELRQVASRRL